MKYFLDTEFLEGTQKTLFSKTAPTIDLISIGIVAEDGREYYAISKEFNLKEAWNRCDLKPDVAGNMRKVYWIRDNVLFPIYTSIVQGGMRNNMSFSYSTMKGILKGFGKTNEQIAREIIKFTHIDMCRPNVTKAQADDNKKMFDVSRPEFYGYYSDYDWVVFCWLFGKMIDLPKPFPMYCIDLRQELDKNLIISRELLDYCEACKDTGSTYPTKNELEYIFHEGNLENYTNYPKQVNEHNALADARWNFELYKFLQTI